MNRPASPAQIQHQAATAFRNRMRRIYPVTLPSLPPILREAAPGETPLSAHEVAWGEAQGHIRTIARVRAFAAGASA